MPPLYLFKRKKNKKGSTMKASYDVISAAKRNRANEPVESYEKIDDKFSCRLSKIPISGAYPTKWRYQSLKTTENAVSEFSTFFLNAKSDQELDLLQKPNQTLSKGVGEFYSLQPPEVVKNKIHIKPPNLLKIFSKFLLNKKNYRNGLKVCNELNYINFNPKVLSLEFT